MTPKPLLNESQSGFLDFARGSAALIVLFAHIQQVLINPYWYPHQSIDAPVHWVLYRHIGSFGVMVFFALSGFLIFLSIFNNLEKSEWGTFDARKFLISRLVRLYPPLLFSLVVCIASIAIVSAFGLTSKEAFTTGNELYLARNHIAFNASEYLGSIFFLNNMVTGFSSPVVNGPLWSLAQEFWFYMVAATFTLAWFSRWALIPVFFVASFLVIYANSFWYYGFLVWSFGALSGWLFLVGGKKVMVLLNMVLVTISLLVWLYALSSSVGDYYFNNRQKFAFGVFVAMSLPLILRLVSRKSRCLGGFISTFVRNASKYAYTLYLIHFPILIVVFVFTNKWAGGRIPSILLIAGLTAAVVIVVSRSIGAILENKSNLIKWSDQLYRVGLRKHD